MSEDNTAARLADLEGRVQDLETRLDMVLWVVAAHRPLEAMLANFGATKEQEKSLLTFLDELAKRVDDARNPPSCSNFQDRVDEIFPEHRGAREFAEVMTGTLAIEREAYRKLYDFMKAHNWSVLESVARSVDG